MHYIEVERLTFTLLKKIRQDITERLPIACCTAKLAQAEGNSINTVY